MESGVRGDSSRSFLSFSSITETITLLHKVRMYTRNIHTRLLYHHVENSVSFLTQLFDLSPFMPYDDSKQAVKIL